MVMIPVTTGMTPKRAVAICRPRLFMSLPPFYRPTEFPVDVFEADLFAVDVFAVDVEQIMT
jgi:hypothetical protein